MRVKKLMLAAAVVALVMSSGSWVNKSTARTKGDDETTKRLNAAADVMRDIMAAPDKGIPHDLLDKAACAVIVPNVKKGAFILGRNTAGALSFAGKGTDAAGRRPAE